MFFGTFHLYYDVPIFYNPYFLADFISAFYIVSSNCEKGHL